MFQLNNLRMLKKPVSRVNPRIHQFFDFFVKNKFKVLIVSCSTIYWATLPFAQWFEGDLSSKRRIEETEKGTKRFGLKEAE